MIIIPVRLKLTRFKEKILCDIDGVPMFIATAERASLVDEVCIAFDDEKVLKIAQNHGFKTVLTNQNHESGTDRVNEVRQILKLEDEAIIINVQTDEPLIEIENLKQFKELSETYLDKEAFMTSRFKKISQEQTKDPNLVKVLRGKFGFVLYSSRAKIPFERESYEEDFRGHLGIYAYSVKALREFCTFENSNLEKVEKLEQLRASENGKEIKTLEISMQSMGIDTKEDYEKVLQFYANN